MQLKVSPAQENPKTSSVDAVTVQNLRHRAGLTTILKTISFSLPQNETLALLGPNGAGKSTLLKCIAGLLPSEGEKLIFGQNPKRNYQLRRRIGYLGHESFLYMKLSARENLEFYADLYDISINASAILEEFRLETVGDQLVETYSRGMKQRLALARTLLNEPDLLLLDEPFTGLDQQSAGMLVSKIKEKRNDRTVIIATHDLDQAADLCSYILLLKNGKVALYSTVADLSQSLSEIYSAAV